MAEMRQTLGCSAFDHAPHSGVVVNDVSAPSRAFDAAQMQILERLAAGDPLKSVLASIVQMIEQFGTGRCSILLLDPNTRTVRHGAAPSLPIEFVDSIDGAPIGPNAGSCGAAAHGRKPVFVRDIATHPNWELYRHLALPHGLRSCWSTPIVSAQNEVVGTFAVYYPEPRDPTQLEQRQVASATHLAAIAIMRDRHERALLLSDRRYRQLLETSHEGVITIDLAGRISFVNAHAAAMLGHAPRQLMGTMAHQLVHPEARSSLEDVLKPRRAGSSEQRELRCVKGDGSDLFVIVGASPILDERNSGAGMLWMLTDVTESRRAQQALARSELELRMIFDSAPIGIALLDAEARPLRYNAMLARILGYEAGELNALDLRSLVHPEDREQVSRLAALLDAGLHDGRTVSEIRLFRKDGVVVWLRVSSARFLPSTPNDALDVALFEDITERKKLETSLMLAQRMEGLGSLAGGIAHDFNNILAAIRGYLDLAVQTLPSEHAAQEHLRVVDVATSRAAELVQQILTFSRRKPVKRQPCQLRPVVEEVLRLLRATLPRMIDIDASFAGDDLPVLADVTQIHQIIMNLGTNGAQALGSHGTLSVQLAPYEARERLVGVASEAPAGPYMCLRVSDDGCGMSAETMARIFDPFFTTKAVGAGTGLGLSVVLGIVRDHGGVMRVASTLGRGTTFEIYLPQARDAVRAPSAPSASLDEPGHGELLLVVDDEPQVLALEQLSLRKLGYRVEAFAHPRAALQALEQRPNEFAALVTDLAMPDLSGIELAAQAHALRPSLPIILASGYIRPEQREQARAAGVRAILTKPDVIGPLAHELAHLLGPSSAS